MLVYRVENARGYGPWNSTVRQSYVDGLLKAMERKSACGHPTPIEDGLSINLRWRYGCKSLDQLHDWFPEPYRQRLFDAGFTVKVYAVPSSRVKMGRSQVAFNPAEAAPVVPMEKLA